MYSCRVKMDRLVTNKNNARYKFVANIKIRIANTMRMVLQYKTRPLTL